MEPLTAVIQTLWRGELPLWSAFWLWGQGVYAVVLAAYIAMYKMSFELLAPFRAKLAADAGWLAQAVKALGTVVNLMDLAGIVLITAFFTVVMWRAAPNTDWVGWTLATRGYLIVFWVFVVLGAVWLYQNR